MDLRDVPALMPLDFFAIEIPVAKSKELSLARAFEKPYLLPDYTPYTSEDSFAKVALTYGDDGVVLYFSFSKPFQDCFYPAFGKGDAIEVMIDTRAIKSSSVVHKFCHHIVVLPKECDGIQACELTKFHGEDKRPLANPDQFEVETAFLKSSYQVKLGLKGDALYGYDPVECPRLGFCFRLHRLGGEPMHFHISSKHFRIEKYPALWATLELG